MDIRKIKKLIEMLQDSDLTEIEAESPYIMFDFHIQLWNR